LLSSIVFVLCLPSFSGGKSISLSLSHNVSSSKLEDEILQETRAGRRRWSQELTRDFPINIFQRAECTKPSTVRLLTSLTSSHVVSVVLSLQPHHSAPASTIFNHNHPTVKRRARRKTTGGWMMGNDDGICHRQSIIGTIDTERRMTYFQRLAVSRK